MAERIVVLDTETTGIEVDRDRVVEIGMVELVDRRLTGNVLHLLVNPERAIPLEASEIHGITDDVVAAAAPFRDIVDQVCSFAGDSIVMAHNAGFDIAFLDMEFRRAAQKHAFSDGRKIIDTLRLARELYPGARVSLDALCDRLGVDRRGREKHGALLDAQLLAEVYQALTRTQHSLFTSQEQQSARTSRFVELLGAGDGPLPVTQATESELRAHRKRMDDIRDKGNGLVLDF